VKKLKRALGCPRKPLALKVATLAGVQESPSSILPPPTSFGSLSKFPKEIRQALYSNVLEVEYPVTARKCRSLRISEREHSRHVKHSDSQEDAGRFNVLLVSKQIYAEASWVLYNHARLHLHIDRSVAPYFAGYNLKTLHRLGSIPRDEKVKNMWKCLAKFRFVEMEVPQTELSEGNPMVYTGRLAEAASLLLKSWENDNDQPTSIVAHTVTIKLGSLFSQIIPFNAYPTLDPFDDIYNRVYRSFPTLDVDFRQIEDECAANLRKLVAIIGSNRGSTNWSTIAFEELHKSKKGGIRQLKAFKAICTKNDIRFEGETVG
jgi:hypothetical protein